MSDVKLDNLAKINIPPSRPEAQERAVLAAMAAFDEEAQKNTAPAQGSVSVKRPTGNEHTLWSRFMNAFVKPVWSMKPATATALGALVMVPLAGVVGWNVIHTDDALLPGKLPQQTVREEQSRPLGRSQKDKEALEMDLVADAAKPAAPALQTTAKQEVRTNTQQSLGKRAIDFAGSQPAIAPSPIVPVQPRAETPVSNLGETYQRFDDNPVKSVASDPVSTFSIDVDTASYARVRRSIMDGLLPRRDMVRVEELINYFDYDYPLPQDRSVPFKPTVSISPTPWNAQTNLLHIGIKGYDVPQADRPRANLVFLLDVSGSMNSPDKLPLLVKSFRLLLQKLNPQDTVSIVTYAGRAATVLKPTAASERAAILDALNNLHAGGSTGGAEGIERAYDIARQSFVDGGVNRVMLATDGDFNVGISDPDQLKDFIAAKRNEGIFLSVFGFGQGNYNDALMQSLAQNGNGTAAYIDTLAEAQKTLVEQAGSTLFPIAKDVKIQIEFNPAKVAEYRLIGYETRALRREDFNNDQVDAGEIGAGHSVTAIYELTPVGSEAVLNNPLRYGRETQAPTAVDVSGEWGFLKLRYKMLMVDKSNLATVAITGPDTADERQRQEARFASAVAAFGQKLRGHPAVADMSYEEIAVIANSAKGEDKFGYRAAFVQLVRMAGSLSNTGHESDDR